MLLLSRSRRIMFAALLLCSGLGLWLYAQATEQQRGAVLLTLDGAVSPASADYLIRGMSAAEEQDAELAVIMLDTPGGLDSSMRSIIKKMLDSSVPVAVYVHPAGARAASAGTFMLYGAHIAAMTPSTNLGSASPVSIGGGGPPGLSFAANQARLPAINGNEEQQADENGSAENEPRRGETAMERKVLEDAVSYIRGLAERYDRNADWAEEAVREGVNIGATEALEKNVIDIIATDLDDLLAQINGMSVSVNGVEQVLNTENLQVLRQDPDWRAELLAIITNPNIAYILMLIGIYGLIFELANPGALYPGIIGSISLILAFFALQVMPVNYAGLALVLLGVVFMLAEAFLPSFGALGVGGLAAFTVGSIMLWDDPALNVALPLIIGTGVTLALFSLWVIKRLMMLRKRKPATGFEEMVGMTGQVREDFDEQGRVWIHSELWNARSGTPLKAGQTVRVLRVDGLVLEVEPVVAST